MSQKKRDYKTDPISEKPFANAKKQTMAERWEKMKAQDNTINPYRY